MEAAVWSQAADTLIVVRSLGISLCISRHAIIPDFLLPHSPDVYSVVRFNPTDDVKFVFDSYNVVKR